MLYCQCETQELLRKIASKFASDPAQAEDLYQEAIIHLWKLEKSCPHHTRSWYLQNCQHFVQDQLRAGRSVDSPKRARQRVAFDDGASAASVASEDDGARENSWSEDEAVSTACFHDLVEKLQSSANPAEFKILQMLFDGFCVNDIARSFGVSHTTIHKQRRRLVALANRLDISLPEASRLQKFKLSLVIQPITDKSQPARAR